MSEEEVGLSFAPTSKMSCLNPTLTVASLATMMQSTPLTRPTPYQDKVKLQYYMKIREFVIVENIRLVCLLHFTADFGSPNKRKTVAELSAALSE